ncbi:MAG: prepilin-type N-terminal cleavage/methylation domain-containing protein [Candidatus Buchananbacteria bacterium]|jgi:prepilin-type N-terminal cleavage/methylation domain-containing protein
MIFPEHIFFESRGLSLAEILVTVAIIALVAAISVPFYRSTTLNLDLNAASRDLSSDLRLAQQLSVTTQINHQVIFTIADNSYLIKNAGSGNIIKSQSIKPPISILSISGFSTDTVAFNSTGAAVESGFITLINPNNRTSTIEIKPSGYVKIQ